MDLDAFDLCGPLPTGTTVLEASAGTGKTFTVASLAARYVADGLELPHLMLVSFSRAATQELRDRVRHRLVEIEEHLADPVAARNQPHDTLAGLLATGTDADVAERRLRIRRALADFDAATIATYHGFCQQMLAGLGMAGDLEPATTFVERIDDLVTEVADDLYLRKFAAVDDDPAFDVATARQIARAAVGDPQARLVPDDDHAAPETRAWLRQRYAEAVRREVDDRKRRLRLMDYDDLLIRLRDALRDPVTGPAAIDRVRSRYRVVMVDEFQDTDPIQWEIVRRAFDGHVTLVLIGDPKQAIYAFRGADLTTYLQAASTSARRTLARNWRSDKHVIDGLGHVFRGAALGDADVVVRPVDAEHVEPRLVRAGAPVRLRTMGEGLLGGGPRGATIAGVRPMVARDVARQVVDLLGSDAALSTDEGSPAPVRPADIAVLVRTRAQADLVVAALRDARVPAVMTGIRSVFRSETAQDWLVLLRAVEQPHRHGLARAAALTCFLGWPVERLASDDASLVDELTATLRGWRQLLVERGVAAMLEVVTSTQQVYERLISRTDGERVLTDLRHIGEALHAAAIEAQLGPAALVEWLSRRIGDAVDEADDERSWRLDSDAGAVQVLTIHTSKGLEWPIVFAPFGWDRHLDTTPDFPRLHDAGGNRVLDVGGTSGPTYSANAKGYIAEELGEDLRLLYVTLTRARCQVVVWWARATTTADSPLHRLLFGDVIAGRVPESRVSLPDDAQLRQRMQQLVDAAGGDVDVTEVADSPVAPWTGVAGLPVLLSAAAWTRALDTMWRRTSYSALTRDAHAAMYGDASAATGVADVTSEPEVEERRDEPATVAVAAAAESGEEQAEAGAAGALPSPMADLPSGTTFGTLVHEVLEHLDTRGGDSSTDRLTAELTEQCVAATAWRHSVSVDPERLAAALLPVVQTPLGDAAGGACLADVATGDRLCELDFELPLAGGDGGGRVASTLADLSRLMREHLPADDPLVGYPDHLDATGIGWQRFSGYLAGSIDAVLRLRSTEGHAQFSIVDYKTNWLGDFGPTGATPLTSWHYRPAVMTEAMIHADYPLQALLYSVVLHRFLRWRQPSYDPVRHVGPVLYLFLRGMCGVATPVVDGSVCGVFSWQVPTGLVVAASDLLDGAA
jgi:exodeoxyribonuclease V beta subunit